MSTGKTITLNNEEWEKNSIFFTVEEHGENVEILRISKDGFYYMGERVDDIQNIYERFNEWLTKAEIVIK